MNEELGVGIVGFGLAGRAFHAPLVSSTHGLRMAGIVARSNAQEARAAYPGVRVVSDLIELLRDESVRVVVIASPNGTHGRLAVEALEAGRDVVVDKPFATSSAEADRVMEVAAKRGRLVTVFQNRRWDGDFLTVKALLEKGTLGRLVLFESHFDRFSPGLNRAKPWKEAADASGGLLWDLGPHLVDQAVELFGLPEMVFADVRSERTGSATDDAFDIWMKYGEARGGLRVLLRASMLAAKPGPRFLLRGETATFTKFGLDPQEAALRAGARPGGDGWGRESEEHWGEITSGAGGETDKVETLPGNYPAFYENLRDVLMGKAELAVTAAEALRVTRLLELARESSQRGVWLPVNNI